MTTAFGTPAGIAGTAITLLPFALVVVAVVTGQFPRERYEAARKRVLAAVDHSTPHSPYPWLLIGSSVLLLGVVIGTSTAYNVSSGPVSHVFDTHADAMSQATSDADSGVFGTALAVILTASTLPAATVTAWVVHHLFFWVPRPAAEVVVMWTGYTPLVIVADGLVHGLVREDAEGVA